METVKSIETYVITVPRETPYLGPLGSGETVNRRGYVVRSGNRTIYPTVDRSVLVKIQTTEGRIGWGETYGICAPKAVCDIINDLLAPIVEGRDPRTVRHIWRDLYDLMRVRGASGGFYGDALAAIDIALWDLSAKIAGVPLHVLLGGARRQTIPAYLSGLPAATRDERIELACSWRSRGFRCVKFAAVISQDGVAGEMAALRDALGDDAEIMVDLHWRYRPSQAISLIRALEPYRPAFAEAPVAPEDVPGLAAVARAVATPIAAGEEWRTVYEALPRFEARAFAIIQPEMAHTGVTQFMAMADLAETFECVVAPHATIGVGVFMAASLHASACVGPFSKHEYQHSVFDRNAEYLDGTLVCRDGAYTLPDGPGLGVEPNPSLWRFAERVE